MQSAFGCRALLAQFFDNDRFELAQLGDRGLNVSALAFELGETGAALFQSELELAHMATSALPRCWFKKAITCARGSFLPGST